MKNEDFSSFKSSSLDSSSSELNKKLKPNQFVEGLSNINKTFVNIIQQNKGGAIGNGPKTWFTKPFKDLNKSEKKDEKSRKEDKSSDNEKENKEILSKSAEIINVKNSSESSIESDIDDTVERAVECACQDHQGKELLNRVFNLDVDTLFSCLFENEEFSKKFWRLCKYSEIKCSEWKPVSSVESRQLEFSIDLGTFGKPRNFEEQKLILKEPEKKFVIQSQSYSTGIMYCDYFTVNCKFCMTKCSSKTSRLFVTLYLDYKKQPNFIIKSFIEKNTFSQLKECFGYMEKLLEEQEALFASKKVVAKKNKKPRNSSNESFSFESNIPALNETNTIQKVVHIEHKKEKYVSSSQNEELYVNNNNRPNQVQYVKFFRWSIKMDTLIRLFILSTFIIMVLNTRLYVKLNNTEVVISNIKKSRLNDDDKNEPKLLEKFLASNDKNLDKWKNFFTHSLIAVRNIESILDDWNNRLDLVSAKKKNEITK